MLAKKKFKGLIDTIFINFVIKTHLKSHFNGKNAYKMWMKKSLVFPLINFRVTFIHQINSTQFQIHKMCAYFIRNLKKIFIIYFQDITQSTEISIEKYQRTIFCWWN
jgi:hypothetical protein